MGSRGGTDRRRERALVIGLLCSLLVHGLLALGLWSRPPTPPPREEREAVRLKILERARKVDRGGERPEGQVVSLPPPPREERPDQARFLDRFDRKVDREKKARRGLESPARSPGTPSAAVAGKGEGEGDRGPAQPPAAGEETVSRRFSDPGKGHRVLAGLERLRGLGQGPLWGAAEGGDGMPGSGDGSPVGVVRGDAFLGVPEEGETTLVNTRSFKYWDFFQRVKERVRAQWNPGPLYAARDPDGRLYGHRDRLTILAVALDAEGRVIRTEVKRESGLGFLDAEAVRAFHKAGPFPNPPAGLVDDQGRIVFTFGFLLEVGAVEGRAPWGGIR